MATEITFKAESSLSSGRQPVRVQESVEQVTEEVNLALQHKSKFVALTDENGKGITVEAVMVDEIREV